MSEGQETFSSIDWSTTGMRGAFTIGCSFRSLLMVDSSQ